jgi:hypothetical protein
VDPGRKAGRYPVQTCGQPVDNIGDERHAVIAHACMTHRRGYWITKRVRVVTQGKKLALT